MVAVIVNIIIPFEFAFSGICEPIFKKYEWFMNCIVCSIQQNKPEISIVFCLVAVSNQMCTHTLKIVAMIANIIIPFTLPFSENREPIFQNYEWLINCIVCSIHQNKLEISIVFCLVAVSDQRCTHTSKMVAMIT